MTENFGGVDFAISKVGLESFAGPSGVKALEPGERGLALVSLKLDDVDPFWTRWLWNRIFDKTDTADLLVISTAFDASGQQPFVWPLPSNEDQARITVTEGEAYEWTLGSGSPIYPPRQIQGSLVVSILVTESREAVRSVGDTMEAVNTALSNEAVQAVLVSLAAASGLAGAAVALEALGVVTGAVADVLQDVDDVHVGAYAGLFSATEPWSPEQLEETDNGASIKLAVVPGA